MVQVEKVTPNVSTSAHTKIQLKTELIFLYLLKVFQYLSKYINLDLFDEFSIFHLKSFSMNLFNFYYYKIE